MKLDYDIVRDILIALEEELSIEISEKYYRNNAISFDNLCSNERLSKYDKTKVLYCVIKMGEAKYIELGSSIMGINPSQHNTKLIEGSAIYTNIPSVCCITFKGHEF